MENIQPTNTTNIDHLNILAVDSDGNSVLANILHTFADQMEELEQQNDELRTNRNQPIVYENTMQFIPFSRLNQKTCSICLMTYNDDDLIAVLPCIHFFHKDCVSQYLGSTRRCPICGDDIRDSRHNNVNQIT